MSTKILDRITDGLSRYGGVEFIDYSKYDYHKDSFYQREIEKTFEPLVANNVFINIQEYGIEKIIDQAGEILERVSHISGGKIALITNTISRAKTFYRISRERFSRGNVILLTSRFTAKDKQEKLKKILGEEKILLISTQVIEVGVDASFDVIITELSPPSSLIQRMGRLARGEKKLGLWSIYYDQTTIEKGSGIYSPEMIRCSMRIIKDLIRDERKINWHLPETSEKQIVGYMNLLDPCWENINITPAYDTYVWEILEKPTITSEQVLRLNIYPRDENLCSLYIGNDIPSHLEELYEESLSRMIPVPCRTASEYINILRKRSYDVYVISYDPYREEILLQHVDDDILRKLYEIFDKPLKLITSNILGITIPEEYYEGGLYGEGLKDVN
jgi:CRISPR/Cas system-associated endonuclease/helicase Cas3